MEDKKTDVRRAFTIDGLGEYFLAQPKADEIKGSEWAFAKYYSKCLMEGIATQSEMYDVLKKRGILGENYEKKLQELKDKIGEKIVAMELESEAVNRKKLAKEVSSLREDLFQWNQRVNSPLSQTCEALSEDQKVEYLTSCMVQKQDGAKVWPTFEDYLNESNRSLGFSARFQTMLLLQGLESTFLENTPENIVLKELAAKEEADKEEAATTAADAAEVVATPVVETPKKKRAKKVKE